MKRVECLVWGMFLVGLTAAVSACGLSGEKAPAQYAEELMEDDIELEFQGNDAMALIEEVQIRTETEPIYNHFPDLPGTSKMQWCSESSKGIGLSTVRVYIFAYYDHDISSELQGMKISSEKTAIDLYFVPEGISRDQKWKCVEDAPFAFQEDIKDTRKKNTAVYINEQGTILYIEAIGD